MRRGRSRTPGSGSIIASSFADIFRSNCGKVGVLCVELHEKDVQRIAELVAADPSVEITVDLEAQRVSVPAVGMLEGSTSSSTSTRTRGTASSRGWTTSG
jgi:3-isopropylmalate dehydratase small subunit